MSHVNERQAGKINPALGKEITFLYLYMGRFVILCLFFVLLPSGKS